MTPLPTFVPTPTPTYQFTTTSQVATGFGVDLLSILIAFTIMVILVAAIVGVVWLVNILTRH